MTDYTLTLTLQEQDILTLALHALQEKFSMLSEDIGVEVGPVDEHRSYTNEQIFEAFNSIADKLYPEDE
jgi:hypothetical protein